MSVTVIEESPATVEAGAASVSVVNTTLVNLISDNDAVLIELSTAINGARARAQTDAGYQGVVDILQIEYNAIAAKNEQLKGLHLENQDIAQEAGIITADGGESAVEGLAERGGRPPVKSTTEVKQTMADVKKKLEKAEVPPASVTDDIKILNDGHVRAMEHKKKQKIDRPVKAKRPAKTLNEVNEERIKKGRKPINKEKTDARRAKLKLSKEQRKEHKNLLRVAHQQWKTETDLVKKAAAKSAFLLMVQQYKNGSKKDTIEEKQVSADENLLAGGTTPTETVLSTDAAAIAEENAVLANNIDGEIAIKEKIVLDAIKQIADGEPSSKVAADLGTKVTITPTLSGEEMAVVAELGLDEPTISGFLQLM